MSVNIFFTEPFFIFYFYKTLYFTIYTMSVMLKTQKKKEKEKQKMSMSSYKQRIFIQKLKTLFEFLKKVIG